MPLGHLQLDAVVVLHDGATGQYAAWLAGATNRLAAKATRAVPSDFMTLSYLGLRALQARDGGWSSHPHRLLCFVPRDVAVLPSSTASAVPSVYKRVFPLSRKGMLRYDRVDGELYVNVLADIPAIW